MTPDELKRLREGINRRSLRLRAHPEGQPGGKRRADRWRGLTQKELAERLGVDSITISRWERGVQRIPESAARLARMLEGPRR